jgi:hypothetical protein
VATTGAARAKLTELPRSRTITIHNQMPTPKGVVEVTPDNGRVHFRNKDKKDYRLRFRPEKTEFGSGIDILLPAEGTVTVLIKRHDEWLYTVFVFPEVMNGTGGGPIRN